MNIIDYIDKYKDKTFIDYSFNDIDNLILANLSYVPFSGIVPSIGDGSITLKEAKLKYFKMNTYNDIKRQWRLIQEVSNMLEKLGDTKRYGDAILYNYVNIVDDNKQFGALAIKLNDDSIYISYEGTDSSLIGWKEDFEMVLNYPIASQRLASWYLNKTIGLFDKNVRVGGHSKGGNLAICAVMDARFYIRDKVIEIYNNDGPGFLKEQAESLKYKKILPKIKMFVPKGSIVGMMLYHQHNYTVVKSDGVGVWQHNGFTWKCQNNKFVVDKLSLVSRKVEKKLTAEVEKLSIEERKKLIEEVFMVFSDNNITDTSQIKTNKIIDIIKSIKNMDKNIKKMWIDFIKSIFI